MIFFKCFRDDKVTFMHTHLLIPKLSFGLEKLSLLRFDDTIWCQKSETFGVSIVDSISLTLINQNKLFT